MRCRRSWRLPQPHNGHGPWILLLSLSSFLHAGSNICAASEALYQLRRACQGDREVIRVMTFLLRIKAPYPVPSWCFGHDSCHTYPVRCLENVGSTCHISTSIQALHNTGDYQRALCQTCDARVCAKLLTAVVNPLAAVANHPQARDDRCLRVCRKSSTKPNVGI